MPQYTPHGPFVNGSAPGIDQSFLNAVEAQLQAVQYGLNFLATPFLLLTNVTINSGVTNTYTATGGSTGVQAGAKAVLINVFFSSASVGAFLTSKPHTATAAANSSYPLFGMIQAINQTVADSAILPVDANGQFDLKANGANCTGIEMSIYGYVY